MSSKDTSKSSSGVYWGITLWLVAATIKSAYGMVIEAVGEKNRSVALGQEVAFECTFEPASGDSVMYGWDYRELCSPAQWSKLVDHGFARNTEFGGNFSYTPRANGAELPPFRKRSNTTLTIRDSRSILAATGGSCSAIAFACRITDQDVNVSIAETQINLYDPARIRGSTYEHVHYVELSNVTLACEATGLPAPNIRWTRTAEERSRPKALPSGFTEHSGTLPSFSATAASAGNYTCFVYNDFGNESKTVQVSVASKPTVRSRNHRELSTEGCYALLVCYAQSTEPITAIWWMYKGRVVATAVALDDGARGSWSNLAVTAAGRDRLVMKKPVITSFNYTSELLVNVTRSDYGAVYSCYFNSSLGESSADVEIIESKEPMPTLSDGQKTYCGERSNHGEPSSSAILRASILLLLLGLLLHDLI